MTMSDEARSEDQPGSDDADALLLEQVRSDLDAVDTALRRLDQGGYGRCQACGDVIDDGTLDAAPATALCAAHGPAGGAGRHGEAGLDADGRGGAGVELGAGSGGGAGGAPAIQG